MKRSFTTSSISNPLWRWELSAQLGSLISLIVLVILLLIYDGDTIWNQHGVTLNAVVAVLATTGKASMMFVVGESIGQWKWLLFARNSRPLLDLAKISSASQGPLGSAKMLWPRYSFSLVHIGATITLLALATDPFAQQLVQYRQDLSNSTDVETVIPRAQRYAGGSETTFFAAPGQPGVTADVDFAMQSAILYGLVKRYETVSQQIEFNCPSGNCTWNPFESLAVCSTCKNVTDQLISYPSNNSMAIDLITGYGSPAYSITTNATTFQLPNGLLINNKNGQFQGDHNSEIYMTTYSTGNMSKTLSFKDNTSLLWAVSIIRTLTKNGSWPTMPVEAQECGIYYCVKRYESVVRNGTLSETETQVEASRDLQSFQPYMYGNLTYNGINLTPDQLLSLEFNNITSSPPRSDLRFGDQFNLSQSAVDGLSSYLQKNLKNDNDLAPNITERQNGSYSKSLVTVNGWYAGPGYSPKIQKVFYESPNLNDTFRSLAKSMSNAIRAGAVNNTVQTGVTQSWMTYYHVVWPWITLHAGLILASMVFLFATVYESTRESVPVWKSHPLAPLSRYAEIGNVLVGADSIDDMEKKASQHTVRFVWGNPYSSLNGDTVELISPSLRDRSKTDRMIDDASEH